MLIIAMIMPYRRKEVACEDFQATNLKAFPKILFETLGCGVFFFFAGMVEYPLMASIS